MMCGGWIQIRCVWGGGGGGEVEGAAETSSGLANKWEGLLSMIQLPFSSF